MNGGPSGFNNAPVTRAFFIASTLFSLFFGIKGRSAKFGLSYQDIFGKLRVLKLIASVFAFSSTPELLFGLGLLYYFRVFERQIGSNKYSFLLCSYAFHGSCCLDVFLFGTDPSLNLLTAGPYGLIFASFVPFFFDIPVSTWFRVFGIRFSDKSFIYLAGLQLLLSSWKRSVIPGICGILAGSLYRLNLLGIRKAKFPEFLATFISRFSWPSTGSPRGSTTRVGTATVPSQAERTYPAPVASSIEPSETSITTLVSMGFDRNSARQALVQARNDVNIATNILLEAQAH
ncbi:Rhomboid-like protein 20 [Linum perenne]